MKQLHLWIKDSDHEFLLRFADDHDLSLSAAVRRLIRDKRRQIATADRSAEAERRIPEPKRGFRRT